ncbi:MAG: Fe-S-containing hydro-lyase [Bacillota bacterium]
MNQQPQPPRKLMVPFDAETARTLHAGEQVLLTGHIYTARDAAHARLVATITAGDQLPVELRDQTIFYAGPAPARPGAVIGSIGPTTSGRMDPYTPALLQHGLTGMIGKGLRSNEVVQAMRECGAVYFAALGGAAALLARSVVAVELVAYEELGTEAIRRLEVKDFPVIVAIDSEGKSLYDSPQPQAHSPQ